MSEIPAIAVEKVSYSYGRNKLRKQILFDVSVEVGSGEIVILTGPSGSGKTTLLTLMGALRAAQEGSLEILGEQLRGASESTLGRVRRQIGYVFQSHNLLPALSVEQNVRMALQLDRARERARDSDRIATVLERVGMADHRSKRIDQLSGGQRQRVAIARALINEPRIILADEPTASLDSASGRDVADLIQELARDGGASVVLVTHDDRILDIADRIVHLEDGRIKELREAVASAARRMLDTLADHDPAGHQMLLGFAVALSRVANADRVLADEEVEAIRRVLRESAELGPGEAEFVMTLAIDSTRSEHERAGSSRSLRSLSAEDKRRVLRSLEQVAQADGDFADAERLEIERIMAEMEA